MTPLNRSPRPAWLRRRLVSQPSAKEVNELLQDLNLHTVCQEAQCPNQMECFGKNTATFMILGNQCSRNCTFCAVSHGVQEPPNPEEPNRVAQAVCRLDLNYVVLTSVSRDDLADGGASLFAETIRAIHATRPHTLVEVLVPDFQGSEKALATVLAANPSVLNHNLETVEHLYPAVRPQASYRRSLQLLLEAKGMNPRIVTKSGFMLGLGERQEEVSTLLQDLRASNCDLITIGQYLCPSKNHHPVVEYIHPRRFQAHQQESENLGFLGVASGPYVRSSYQAEDLYRRARSQLQDRST